MEKAKHAIENFLTHDGEHNTVVDQDQRKAITEEHILPSRHEEVTTAVDREVHQDHHRTVVQPIRHSEKTPEKHHHNLIPVEHKSFEHDNTRDAEDLLTKDAAKYRDSSVTHDTKHTSSKVPVIGSEHVHHHFHDHIQPVITKEVHRPEVVHTTVPIHEVHHAATVDHGTTTLPEKTWEEFEKAKGTMAARASHTTHQRQGCANDYANETARLDGSEGRTSNLTDKHGRKEAAVGAAGLATAAGTARKHEDTTTGTGLSGSTTDRTTGSTLADRTTKDSSTLGRTAGTTGAAGMTGTTGTTGMTGTSGTTGVKSESMLPRGGRNPILDDTTAAKKNVLSKDGTTAAGTTGASRNERGLDNVNTATGNSKTGSMGSAGSDNYKMSNTASSPTQAAYEKGTSAAGAVTSVPRTAEGTQARKVSLKDKLNPFKDADGDGKKGIMS